MCPRLSRPPLLFFCSTSRDSGLERVISSNVGTVLNRVAGVSGLYLRSGMALYLLEELDGVPLLQGHQSFLPIGSMSRDPALPLGLAVHADRAHRVHLHVEDRLDRALDFDLVRIAGDLEEVPVLLLAKPGALLGDHRAADDGAWLTAHAFTRSPARAFRALPSPPFCSAACTRSVRLFSPSSVSTSESQFMSSYVWSVRLSAVRTRARFRADLRAFSSIRSKIQRTLRSPSPTFSISSASAFVLGSSSVGASRIVTPPSRARADRAPQRARSLALALRRVV